MASEREPSRLCGLPPPVGTLSVHVPSVWNLHSNSVNFPSSLAILCWGQMFETSRGIVFGIQSNKK